MQNYDSINNDIATLGTATLKRSITPSRVASLFSQISSLLRAVDQAGETADRNVAADVKILSQSLSSLKADALTRAILGVPEGVATLDANGYVPASQIRGNLSGGVGGLKIDNIMVSLGVGAVSVPEGIELNGRLLTPEQALTVWDRTAHYLPWEWGGSGTSLMTALAVRTSIPSVVSPDGMTFPNLKDTHMEVAHFLRTSGTPNIDKSGLFKYSGPRWVFGSTVATCHELESILDVIDISGHIDDQTPLEVATNFNTPRLRNIFLSGLSSDIVLTPQDLSPESLWFLMTNKSLGLGSKGVTVRLHPAVYNRIFNISGDITADDFSGIADYASAHYISLYPESNTAYTKAPSSVSDYWHSYGQFEAAPVAENEEAAE